MNKILLLLMLLILRCSPAFAVTCNVPSSTYTYVSGQVILPNQVQTNENNLYSYAQAGVCNYLAGSITQAAVSSTAGILYSQLNLSGGILPGDINTITTTSIYQFENVTVPYNFIIGTPHQGDVLYDNGTSLIRLTPGTAGKVLQTQGASANPQWGFPSGQLGAWASRNVTQVYQETTDGIVVASLEDDSGGIQINGITDSSATPTTVRVRGLTSTAAYGSITFPVKKGDYWEVTGSGTINNSFIYFIPLGS